VFDTIDRLAGYSLKSKQSLLLHHNLASITDTISRTFHTEEPIVLFYPYFFQSNKVFCIVAKI